MDLKGLKETQGPTVKMDHQELLEKRGNLEFPVCLVTLEDKDQRVPTASLDSLVPMERKERGESPAKLAPEASAARRDHVVDEVHEDQLGNLGPREPLAMTDPLVLLVNGDLMDLRGLLVSPDPRGQTVQPVKMACLDTQDKEERRDSKERLDLQDLVELWDLRVRPEKLDPVESEDTPDLQGHLESKVCLELLAKKEERVIQVSRVLVASPARLVSEVSKAPEVFPERWVQEV